MTAEIIGHIMANVDTAPELLEKLEAPRGYGMYTAAGNLMVRRKVETLIRGFLRL